MSPNGFQLSSQRGLAYIYRTNGEGIGKKLLKEGFART